jgi:3-mercaptopyruvate sulfurtransferase SseA
MSIRTCAAAAALAVAALAAVATTTTRLAAEAGQVAPAAAPRMSLQEFKKLLDKGEVVVIDVRGAESYAQGRIPGAVLVPLETVSARAAEFKDVRKPVVTYCA